MNMKEEIENAFDELEIKVENACGEMDQISSDIKTPKKNAHNES